MAKLIATYQQPKDAAHFTLIDRFCPVRCLPTLMWDSKKVITHIADSDDLRCLNLCMAYGVSVPVEPEISVNIGGAGLGYIATLIRRVNRADTMNASCRRTKIDQFRREVPIRPESRFS